MALSEIRYSNEELNKNLDKLKALVDQSTPIDQLSETITEIAVKSHPLNKPCTLFGLGGFFCWRAKARVEQASTDDKHEVTLKKMDGLLARMKDLDARYMLCEPGSVRRMRRFVVHLSNAIYRRHWFELFQFPFRFACIPDTWIPASWRRCTLDEFFKYSACCLRRGMARNLRSRPDIAKSDLASPFWSRVFLAFSYFISRQIADVGRRHRRNRISTMQHKGWKNFVADYTTAEAKLMQSVAEKTATLLFGLLGMSIPRARALHPM